MFKRSYWSTLLLVLLDILSAFIAIFLSVLLLNQPIEKELVIFSAVSVAAILVSFFAIRIYDIVYSNAGLFEAIRVLLGCAAIALITFGASALFIDIGWRIPVIFNIIFSFMACCQRFSKRFYNAYKKKYKDHNKDRKRVMIIGAGNAGALIIRELQSSKHLTMNPVCVLDDDPLKQKKLICS